MKKIILLIAAVLISALSHAQSFNIGPRIGVSQSFLKVDETIDNVKYESGKALVGFHAGAFARIKLASFYVQPEVLFTSTGGQIDLNDPNNPERDVLKYNYNRIDVPVLVGLKASAFRVNLGPVATFNINSKDKSASELKDEVKEKYKTATFAFQAGIGLDIWKLVFDLKYEAGLGTMTDKVTVDGQTYNFDQRGRQVLLSVGFKLL